MTTELHELFTKISRCRRWSKECRIRALICFTHRREEARTRFMVRAWATHSRFWLRQAKEHARQVPLVA